MVLSDSEFTSHGIPKRGREHPALSLNKLEARHNGEAKALALVCGEASDCAHVGEDAVNDE